MSEVKKEYKRKLLTEVPSRAEVLNAVGQSEEFLKEAYKIILDAREKGINIINIERVKKLTNFIDEFRKKIELCAMDFYGDTLSISVGILLIIFSYLFIHSIDGSTTPLEQVMIILSGTFFSIGSLMILLGTIETKRHFTKFKLYKSLGLNEMIEKLLESRIKLGCICEIGKEGV